MPEKLSHITYKGHANKLSKCHMYVLGFLLYLKLPSQYKFGDKISFIYTRIEDIHEPIRST